MKLHKDIALDLMEKAHQRFQERTGIPYVRKHKKGRSDYFDDFLEDIAAYYDVPENHLVKINSDIRISDNNGKQSNFSDWLRRTTLRLQYAKIQTESDDKIALQSNGMIGLDMVYVKFIFGYAIGKWEQNLKKCENANSEVVKREIEEYFSKIEKKDLDRRDSPKKIFFQTLWKNIREKTDSTISFIEYLDNGFNRDLSTIKKFYIADPASLIAKSKNRKNFEVRNKHYSDSKANEVNVFKNSEGLLLCHALSIHSDNLFLLCELGRFLRIAEVFGINEKKIFLTDKDFAKLNSTVSSYIGKAGSTEYPQLDVDRNLDRCKNFRLKLYEKAGISRSNIQTYGYNEINNNASIFAKSSIDIDAIADGYVEICQEILSEMYTSEKIDDSKAINQMSDMINSYKSYNYRYANKYDKNDLFHTELVRERLRPDIDLIVMVLQNLSSISETTFKYFFLQYCHQLNYNNYLKVSVKREKRFDKTFEEYIQNTENAKRHNLYGLYFNDYVTYKDNKSLSIHPYYFPSGKLQDESSSILEAEKFAILIKDDRDKIKKVIKQYFDSSDDGIELAKVMADLFSFADHFFYRNPNKRSSNFKRRFRSIFHSIPSEDQSLWKEFLNSWDFYTSADLSTFQEKINCFQQNLMTHFEDLSHLPYWFYPFILNDEIKEKELIDVYTELIHTILIHLQEETECRHWTIS